MHQPGSPRSLGAQDSGLSCEYGTTVSPAGTCDSHGGGPSTDPRWVLAGGETETNARVKLCKPLWS